MEHSEHTVLMFGIYVSMALLGLSAIDPIGIATMPILLLQNHPFRRSLIFLGGSFISLMVMGLLFSQGLGAIVLKFENTHTWVVPSAEAIGGFILLCIAGTMLWRKRSGRLSVEPEGLILKRLQFVSWQLFLFGALLVAVQSLVDVVFVIAMIRIGQLHETKIALVAAVATYSIMALLLQCAVVAAYKLAPTKHRIKTLDTVQDLLSRYANQAVIGVSILLGCGLLILASQR